MMKQAQNVRKEDQLNKNNLALYLSKNIDEFNQTHSLSIKQYAGGASNLTYLLEWSDRSIILRTAPIGIVIKNAHDMSREYKVLKLLYPHFNYAPKPLILCEDESVIGRKFYLMQKIDGIILRRDFNMPFSNQQANLLCQNLIDVHVALHSVDVKQTGLIELGHPQGYIKRQISGWNDRYKNAMLDDSYNASDIMQWLTCNQPDDEMFCLIHNDYKLDNVVLSPSDPTEIIAVLDWEMATIGSPLMDLGCSLAYWIEAHDSAEMQAIRMMPTNHKGMWTRDQLIDYYVQKSKLDISNFNYYYIFGLFRLAVIVQQIYQRFAQGKTSNPKFKSFGGIAKILIQQAEKFVGENK